MGRGAPLFAVVMDVMGGSTGLKEPGVLLVAWAAGGGQDETMDEWVW